MKKTLAFVFAAIAAGGLARGEFSMSSDISFATEYVFRGLKYGDNTLHPSIELKSDSFYAGVWGALPIDKRSSKGWGDEFDFYLGFNHELSDTIGLDFGVTHYYYPAGDSTLEGYVGVTQSLSGLTLSGYAYYDLDLENLTLQGSIGYSVPLQSMGTSLDLSATVGHVSVDDGDSYLYYGVSAVVPYKINDNATVSVGVHWATNDIYSPGVDDSYLYGTVGLTIGF